MDARVEDDRLIDRAIAQDETVLTGLMQQMNQRLFRLARSVVRDEAEAEDVVQDAYVRAFTHISQLRDLESFPAWISRITYTEALKHLARRRTSPGQGLSDCPLNEASPDAWRQLRSMARSPEQETDRHEVRAMLVRAIDRLPASFRMAFVLREVEGLSTDEAAALLDIPPETVRTRVHRARARLRRELTATFNVALHDIFSFAGHRCDRTVAAVLRRLRIPPDG